MKPTLVLVSALVISVVCATIVSLILAPRSAPAAHQDSESAPIDELRSRQADLEARIDQLREELGSRSAPVTRDERVPVLADDYVARIVTRVLEERGLAAEAAPPADRHLASSLLSGLLDPNLDEAERARIWEQIRNDGLIDEALEEFERRAEAAPNDSLAQMQLGQASFQKMLSTAGGPEAGHFGERGARAMARALELDESNWDARYSLAQHYYWAGLRGDSIHQFETLIEKQKGVPPSAKHALAYLWLGNIYMDQGRPERAKELWSEGLRLHPYHEGLRRRLEEFE